MYRKAAQQELHEYLLEQEIQPIPPRRASPSRSPLALTHRPQPLALTHRPLAHTHASAGEAPSPASALFGLGESSSPRASLRVHVPSPRADSPGERIQRYDALLDECMSMLALDGAPRTANAAPPADRTPARPTPRTGAALARMAVAAAPPPPTPDPSPALPTPTAAAFVEASPFRFGGTPAPLTAPKATAATKLRTMRARLKALDANQL